MLFTTVDVSISIYMECSEHSRLGQQYEAAFQSWAQVELTLKESGLPDATRRLGQELEKKALHERNAAYARIRLHGQSCHICSHRRN
jgi:hypothetical protein